MFLMTFAIWIGAEVFRTDIQRCAAVGTELSVRTNSGTATRTEMFACHPLIEDGMCIPYRAETVWLGIRHALAWHDKPEGDWTNVRFDPPLNRSDQPQPVVKLNEKQEAGNETKRRNVHL